MDRRFDRYGWGNIVRGDSIGREARDDYVATERLKFPAHGGSVRLLPETPNGLHVFADGCYEPNSGQGGWAFVAYKDVVEIASGFGGVQDSANNSMELIALLKAAMWVNAVGFHAELSRLGA